MPKVSLISSNGTTRTTSGGCFGFTGRGGTISGFGPKSDLVNGSHKLETYRYHVGEAITSTANYPKKLKDPRDFLKWIAEASPWSKYCKGLTLSEDARQAYLDIRCDIPGHCVIGTASAARLASHGREDLIPFWNRAVAAGADPMITLLVFYALGRYVSRDFSYDNEGNIHPVRIPVITDLPTNGTSGTMSIGDDEVLSVSNITSGTIYSLINGDFEMKRIDNRRESLYETSVSYEQEILNSYRDIPRGNKNLSLWLLDRFRTTLPISDTIQYSSSSGMGSSSSIVSTKKSPVYISTLIGWSLQLTSEFVNYNRFLGWRV